LPDHPTPRYSPDALGEGRAGGPPGPEASEEGGDDLLRSRTEAARVLGISRRALIYKLKAYGLGRS
jgi:hypothetical protein